MGAKDKGSLGRVMTALVKGRRISTKDYTGAKSTVVGITSRLMVLGDAAEIASRKVSAFYEQLKGEEDEHHGEEPGGRD